MQVDGSRSNDLILDVNGLRMTFGGLCALDCVSLDLRPGEIVGLIGPNGAGKTTFFNCLTGIYAPTGGEIRLFSPDGKSLRINGRKPNAITRLGLARTFQNIRLFPEMTVLENVMVGRHCRTRSGILGALARNRRTRDEEHRVVEDCLAILDRFSLSRSADDLARNLPYGLQRRLEIARAMATNPVLLLLDEPAAGMNARETRELSALIRRLRDEDRVTVFLIEHDMKLVMELCERIFVMDYGRNIGSGTPEEVRRNPQVIRAYLGANEDEKEAPERGGDCLS
ncbi:MAG: ABC transporter ATP-binding protein [Thermodesulfobacteriota bacterium]